MLRGQWSLSRLVGKRRRLDSSPTVSCLDAVPNESAREGGDDPASSILNPVGGNFHSNKEDEVSLLPIARLTAENFSLSSSSRNFEKENHSLSWVKCPVCEKDIQEDNGLINTHLDFCLVEQSNCESKKVISSHFGSVQMPAVHKRLSLKNAKQRLSKSNSSEKAAEGMVSVVSMFSSQLVGKEKNAGQANSNEMRGGCQPKTDSVLGSDSKFRYNVTETKASQNDNTDLFMHNECNCSCHYKINDPKLNEEIRSLDHCNRQDLDKGVLSLCEKPCNPAELVVSQRQDQVREVLTLETVIVGRKFNRHAKAEKDMEIKVLREPENPKDGNAIKIVGPDNQGNLTMGHLPRNLASLLSGLLDKELLKIEGFIVKVPEKAFEPVPIKLLCEKSPRAEEEDNKCFEEMWQRILEVGQIANQRQDSSNQPSKYVHNFSYLLKAVLERESHLFDEKELGFLGSFFLLTEGAQSLFVRLSQRKGPWFRVSQINYADIPDVEQASNELLASGFFSAGDGIEEDECLEKSLRERMHVLNVPELKHFLSMVKFKNKRVDSCTPKRDDLLDWIVSAAKEKHQNLGAEKGSNEVAILPLILKLIGLCVRISDTASFLLWRLQRLFFLNGEQDISSFLLADMGAIKYPSYFCSQTGKAFVNREALLAYEQALEVAQAMDMAVESNDLKSIELCLNRASLQLTSNKTRAVCTEDCGPKDAFLARFSAAWVFATVITLGVSVLERERRYAEAIKLLKQLLNQSCCPGRRGYWTVRLSMDLEHLGYKEESLEVAEAGLNDCRIRHGDRVALQRRVLRLGKPPRRWKKPSFAKALAQSCKEVTITGRPLNCQTGVKSRFYGYDDDQCSVEELALQYYAGDSGGGWQGVHSESGIWMTLFALLMWDVLFAEIPNVFWHPFQTAPLDLRTDAFYPGRETIIEAQLKRIQCGEAPQLLAMTWSKWFGTFCMGLNWERHSLQELQVMASCVGGRGLASICRLLAEDYAGLAGGMPDLFLWRVPNTSVPCGVCCGHCPSAWGSPVGEAKLVEVKGPRDRLSEQQRAWISILMEAGIHVEVCKGSHIGEATSEACVRE
eukprot:c16733_g1_i1 orf=226-3453(-)